MTNQRADVINPEPMPAVGPYHIYSAGGLFIQDELATNVMIKEAVWRLSKGKFQIFLPQSREVQELNMANVEAHVRNTDLLEVIKADLLLARFDGPDPDSGSVLEYSLAKFLGKPTVILRCDFRQLVFVGEPGPYNLMLKNFPRTVEIQLHSFKMWGELLAEARGGLKDSETPQDTMEAELETLQKSVDIIASQVIAGFEKVIAMQSPYPPEYQELVYRAARHSIGSDFDQLLPEGELEEILGRLKETGTL